MLDACYSHWISMNMEKHRSSTVSRTGIQYRECLLLRVNISKLYWTHSSQSFGISKRYESLQNKGVWLTKQFYL